MRMKVDVEMYNSLPMACRTNATNTVGGRGSEWLVVDGAPKVEEEAEKARQVRAVIRANSELGMVR